MRSATAADAAGIAEVHVETWRDAYAGLLPDSVLLGLSPVGETANWRRTIAGADGEQVMVAGDGRRGIVGYGSCGRARGKVLPYRGEVYTLYVHPNHQGRGIGRALLRAQFARLARRGRSVILIWVLAANPARFFYRAMAGAQVALRDEKLFGTTLREATYGWPDVRACLPPAEP